MLLKYLIVLAAFAPGLSAAQRARADGDPASDVLLAQNAFYPFQPPVAPALETALNEALSRSAQAGLPLKVAIIGSREDLGLDPRFFGYPRAYARYLDREISFNQVQPLLVVMAAGYGTIAAGQPSALAAVPVDTRHANSGLTRSAILAVLALNRARGHPILMHSIPPPSRAGSGPPATLLFALPIALLILAGVLALRRGRPKKERIRPPDSFLES